MRATLPALLALALTGCPAEPVDGLDADPPDARPVDRGGDGPPDAMDADADAGADATADAADAMTDGRPDTAPIDAMAADALPDALPDAMPDATPPDLALDATPPDLALDATPDLALDAAPDLALDAAPDLALDGGPDRFIPIWDAEIDMTPDLAVDAEPDLAVDAEPDMAPFDGPARDDDFEQGPLGRFWQRLNPQLFDDEVRDGALWITPIGRGLWFDRSAGPLVHQTITGDFRVTARVRARRRSAPAEPPDQLVHIGGLMARDPQSPPENYVFVVVGRDVDDLSVETKTTVDGRSTFIGPPWPHGSDAELRICRLGFDFHMYKRPIEGGEWQLAESFLRDDLPPTLLVGMIAYTNSAEPDLTVGFEEISFTDVEGIGDCTAD